MTRCKLFLLMMCPKKVSFHDTINCMMFLFSPILSITVSFSCGLAMFSFIKSKILYQLCVLYVSVTMRFFVKLKTGQSRGTFTICIWLLGGSLRMFLHSGDGNICEVMEALTSLSRTSRRNMYQNVARS